MKSAPPCFWDGRAELHMAPLEIPPHSQAEGGLSSSDSCLSPSENQINFLVLLCFFYPSLRFSNSEFVLTLGCVVDARRAPLSGKDGKAGLFAQ